MATLESLFAQHGAELPLDVAAALMAAEEQGLHPNPALIQAELDGIAAGARVRDGTPVVEAVARINHRLFHELGFQGDAEEYDAPENSFLDRVLARRRGLPILLSLLYIEIGRRVGVPIVGIGFPSHYLVKPTGADFYVDPFHSGQILRPDQLRAWLQRLYRGGPISEEVWQQATATNTPLDILARMNRNLKFSYLRRDNLTGAVRASERLLVLLPDAAEERRDLGRMLLALGRVEDGLGELAHYLALRPTASDAWQITQELSAHKGRKKP